MLDLLRGRAGLLSWLGLTGIGLGLVFFRIGHHGIWGDEAFSMAMVEHGYGEILRIARSDSHPPLYFFALKPFAAIFGQSREVLRGFSALGLLAAALLIGAGPVSRIFNRRTGWIYAFLMLFSSMNLTYAQEMRMYTWVMFIIAACATLGYLHVRDGRRRDLVLFGLASLGGVYIHYYATIGVFFVHLYLLGWILLRHRARLRFFLLEAACVALLFTPWIYTMSLQVARNVRDFWIPEPTLWTLLDTLAIPFAVKTGAMSYAPLLVLACLVFLVYGLFSSRKKLGTTEFILMGVGVFLAVFATVLVLSLMLRPILVPRYMLAFWVLLFMGTAWGLERLFGLESSWGRGLAGLFLAVYALLAVPSLNLLYFYQLNGPMNEVARYGRDNFHQGQAFIHLDENTVASFAVEFPEFRHFLYQSPTSTFYDSYLEVFGDRVIPGRDYRKFAADYNQLWVVWTPDSPNQQAYQEVSRYFTEGRDRLAARENGKGEPAPRKSPYSTLRFASELSDFTIDLTLVEGRKW